MAYPALPAASRRGNGRRGEGGCGWVFTGRETLPHLGRGPLCNAMLGFWVAEEEESSGDVAFGCSCTGSQATPASILLQRRAGGACPAPTAWAAAWLQPSGLFFADALGKLGHGHHGEDVRFVMRWADLSADSHSRSLELEAGDFPSGGAGTGPPCLLSRHPQQAAGRVLSGGREFALRSFCCVISLAVVCFCCTVA